MRKKFKLKRVVIIAALLYVGYILVSTQIAMNKIKQQLEVKQQELADVKYKNTMLQDEVKMSKTDAFIEKLARETLGLIKKGETPVIKK
jgi:cell division protein FtsL